MGSVERSSLDEVDFSFGLRALWPPCCHIRRSSSRLHENQIIRISIVQNSSHSFPMHLYSCHVWWFTQPCKKNSLAVWYQCPAAFSNVEAFQLIQMTSSCPHWLCLCLKSMFVSLPQHYIHGSSQGQFIVETYIVIFLSILSGFHAAFAFCTLGLFSYGMISVLEWF